MTEKPERCAGKSVPFGSEYTAECKTCARTNPQHCSLINWMGPVTFEGKCPYKIINQGS